MIGILVGTVVVSQYTQIMSYIEQAILAAGKKCYQVLVGKLNEPKLKNLPTIDLYVYVGCRETSLIGNKEFMMPVCTPHELFLALRPDCFPWDCKILTDFQLLIPTLSTMAIATQSKAHNQDEINALVQTGHRELVPIFSVQVLQKYE